MQWLAQAPANIALIKYMGKKEGGANLPDNASLSYTLNHLLTTVRLEQISAPKDVWEPLNIPGAPEFVLSLASQKRYIDHLVMLKNYFGYRGSFLIQSSNNFPHSSGLASSASSFAALTKCAVRALTELTNKPLISDNEQAELSRLGSGSSCRSFFSPWALWEGNEVKGIELPYDNLIHQVIVVSSAEKKVSSSEAHQRVKSSPFYADRPQRAEERLKLLLDALMNKDWEHIFTICWREFQDMHHLFSSCTNPFSYISTQCLELLRILEAHWNTKGDGPIVTMDAGPNIHLLYRPDQAEQARQFKSEYLLGNYDVL
ncbi:diphosphomevalonate/mevalonate 3,5-bisphosphate decarboxylase family protein [Legionella worsleiensis]|uniref:Mevalonate diphosphate decarboxylase n=1 Tax=Legionella worsleiensis TaxID=45076 RepID=A0A0W1AJ96_9GAMM|nr:diphosphomevalonate decarboxylase [Legionella worsleiensis]KTD81280.1 mevalonate diphosphate decarboxylase [Legionella worsleiensis]STY30841.1 mevalonate diphosphate decarboxylase [Legionella worsleiensis]